MDRHRHSVHGRGICDLGDSELVVSGQKICHLCGHKIGAWNKDPYKIGDRPVCDRCWKNGGDHLAEDIHREKVAGYQRAYREKNREKVAAQKRELEFLRERVAELEEVNACVNQG